MRCRPLASAPHRPDPPSRHEFVLPQIPLQRRSSNRRLRHGAESHGVGHRHPGVELQRLDLDRSRERDVLLERLVRPLELRRHLQLDRPLAHLLRLLRGLHLLHRHEKTKFHGIV